MKLKAIPGFILGKKINEGWIEGKLWVYNEQLNAFEIEVLAVGRSTYGYDNKFYDTSEVEVGDIVVVEPDVVWFEVFDGEKFITLYKVPIDKVLFVKHKNKGGKQDGTAQGT